MHRLLTTAIAVLAVLVVASAATAATKLTNKNSVEIPYYTSSSENFRGTNCGSSVSVVKNLPAGTHDIKVTKPVVGETSGSGGSHVTAVTIAGTVVTLTVTADGPAICDPALTGIDPGQPVNWDVDYNFRAEYKRRAQVEIRQYFEAYESGTWKIAPKTMYDSRKGTKRAFRTRITGIHWSQFGGKKAVGSGKLRLDYCGSAKCPGNNKKTKLIADKPGYCKSSGKFEYKQFRYKQDGHFNTTPLNCG